MTKEILFKKDISTIEETFYKKLKNKKIDNIILNSIDSIEKINYGWSIDRKYILVSNNKKFIFRLTDCEKDTPLYNYRLKQYNNLSNIKSNYIPKTIDYYHTNNIFLTVLEYLEGKDLEKTLPLISEKEQYNLGLQAGNILKEIHNTKIDNSKYIDWGKKYHENNINKIKLYKELIEKEPKYKVKNMDKAIDILLNKGDTILKRPVTLCHGDYHIGNMIVNNNQIYIIDFGSSSIEDPYEEYDRYIFTLKRSQAFANGQIHGYFNGNPDIEFFELIKYYTCRNYIASITWSIPFGEKEVDVAMENINLIDKYYDEFNLTIPNWYINIENINY